MQTIEGSPATIRGLFSRIQKDPRHVEFISFGERMLLKMPDVETPRHG